MLDADTKRRIDTARDILVGKVPDPKSQVEQITIALIYKFMDDLDAESEELGGERTFFAGEFARYGWAKLMQPGIGGHEMLNLYAEAIVSMPENPGIPPLFRDIFNNAFLPYRDPETLRAFLKVINEFTYDHSERLGDAFEYLLSVLGAQGDAGQFRTPRHVIDFIIAVVDPKKDETILDPACGTAGFLISAYRHILAANTDDDGLSTLNPDDRGRLVNNFSGYDISPDMVRLSLANMYLHGFLKPRIHEYDTLTSEERWNEYADVTLANPPFMSPKGGIRPHNRFSVKSKRSEVLFVDYMAEHLTANGRAGIIVPEGIIFQSQTAYKQLRKMLVEDYLVAVVSLPAGVFNPYSGVKTSILILDRALAKRTDTIAFFKVENDGFNLGAQRRPIEQNDLPNVQVELCGYMGRLRAGESVDEFQLLAGHVIAKENIAGDGEYNLSGERYRDTSSGSSQFTMVPLGQVARFIRGVTFRKSDQLERETEDSLPVVTTKAAQETRIVEDALYYIPRSLLKDDAKLLQPGDILISTANSLRLLGRTTHVQAISYPVSFGAFMSVIRPDSSILDTYLICCLRTEFAAEFFVRNANTTTNISNLNLNTLGEFLIPLPPLEVQREIVAEIEGYQKVIDGARAVVENYRPHIAVDPEWLMVKLGDVCCFKRGPFGGSLKKEIFVQDGYAIYEQSHAISQDFSSFRYFISENKYQEMKHFIVRPKDIIMSCSGTMGRTAIVPDHAPPGIINQALLRLHVTDQILTPFLKLWMDSPKFQQSIENVTFGAAIRNVASVKTLKALMIPIPPLPVQQAIVAQVEAEQALVEASRKLVERFEGKIQEAVSRVWGEELPYPHA